MRGKAVWPSIRLYFAPVEVAASLALIAMVVIFALVALRVDGHQPLPTNANTGAALPSVSAPTADAPVLPSSPEPSPVAQPQPATNLQADIEANRKADSHGAAMAPSNADSHVAEPAAYVVPVAVDAASPQARSITT